MNNQWFSKVVVWLVIALVLFTVFKQFDRGVATGTQIGYSDFLLDPRSGLPEDSKKCLQGIRTAASDIAELVEQLRQIAAETGHTVAQLVVNWTIHRPGITAALCGAGVPGMASFWAELLVFIATVKVYPVAGLLAIAALVVGALFALRVVQSTFFNEPNPKFTHFEDVSPFLGLPRMILIGTLLLFGFFPQLMVSMIKSSVIPFLQGM